MDEPLLEIGDPEEDRYATLHLIPWWDQDRLRAARVLVAGVGALGNEVLKNLALVGVGNVLIADFDTVQAANLSRSILFRRGDSGRRKVDVAAERLAEINPDVRVATFHGDIITELGHGLYDEVDLVLGCLDSRAARVAVNRGCARVGVPWIDGALDVMMGSVRVLTPPEGPCYECVLTEQDYALMNLRYACPLLRPEDLVAGRMPTTPTIAAIIAGMQVQEALKLLHGLETAAGHTIYYNGLTHRLMLLRLTRRAGCFGHEPAGRIVALDAGVDDLSVGGLLAEAAAIGGGPATLWLNPEVVSHFHCPGCGRVEAVFRPFDAVVPAAVACPQCGQDRIPRIATALRPGEAADVPLRQLGIPALHIVAVETAAGPLGLKLAGDRRALLAAWDGTPARQEGARDE